MLVPSVYWTPVPAGVLVLVDKYCWTILFVYHIFLLIIRHAFTLILCMGPVGAWLIFNTVCDHCFQTLKAHICKSFINCIEIHATAGKYS